MYVLFDRKNGINVFDEFGCLLAGTRVFCIRRNNQRNQIHGMELDILAIPNRMLVQRAPAILYVVSDTDRFYQMKESAKKGLKMVVSDECLQISKLKTHEFTSPVYSEMNIFNKSKLR